MNVRFLVAWNWDPDKPKQPFKKHIKRVGTRTTLCGIFMTPSWGTRAFSDGTPGEACKNCKRALRSGYGIGGWA